VINDLTQVVASAVAVRDESSADTATQDSMKSDKAAVTDDEMEPGSLAEPEQVTVYVSAFQSCRRC
jgi:hypothetical protein